MIDSSTPNPLRQQQASRPPVPAGWLTRQQAADRLGIGLRTLDLWRKRALDPPAALVPNRGTRGRVICLYRTADIEEFRRLMKPRGKFGQVTLRPGKRGTSVGWHSLSEIRARQAALQLSFAEQSPERSGSDACAERRRSAKRRATAPAQTRARHMRPRSGNDRSLSHILRQELDVLILTRELRQMLLPLSAAGEVNNTREGATQ